MERLPIPPERCKNKAVLYFDSPIPNMIGGNSEVSECYCEEHKSFGRNRVRRITGWKPFEHEPTDKPESTFYPICEFNAHPLTLRKKDSRFSTYISY